MTFQNPNIAALAANPSSTPPPFTISPSDTMRMKAFGGGFDFSPNPLDATTAASNTEVISVNNSIIGQSAGDVPGKLLHDRRDLDDRRRRVSTTPFKNKVGNEVGTSQLANTTMETYQQGPNNLWSAAVNCFTCHKTNTVAVSHVFCKPGTKCARGLQPLFP